MTRRLYLLRTLSLLLLVFPLQALAQKPELYVQAGHSSWITSVVFSADGKTLASRGNLEDATARLWTVSTGRELRAFRGHADYVKRVVFSPNGKILASVANDGIKLWDVLTGTELQHPLSRLQPDGILPAKVMTKRSNGRLLPFPLRLISGLTK